MMEQVLADRIVVSREVMHGKPRVAGTRITVVQVLDLLAAGKTPAEICSGEYFPDLTPEDVQACVAFASASIQADRFVPTAC